MLSHRRKDLKVEMLGEERWAEIRRQDFELGQTISAIAVPMDLDRETLRDCIRDEVWRSYQRRAKADTLLPSHAEWRRRRAPEAHYSARILQQELKAWHGYRISYETVKRYVAVLCELAGNDALTQTRFEFSALGS